MRELRESNKLTLKDAASKLRLTSDEIYLVENGLCPFGPSTALQILELIALTPSDREKIDETIAQTPPLLDARSFQRKFSKEQL